MKGLIIQAALLWLAIVAEQSRMDLLPSYSLLLPCCCLCLATKKSTASLVVVGFALLIQDLLRMESIPVVTVGLLVLGTFVATRSEPDPMSRRHHLKTHRLMSNGFLLPTLLFTSGTLMHFGYQTWQYSVTVPQLQSYLIVATPVFLVALAILRISREFGFRYSIS